MPKKFELEKEEILWKDRRRRLGLPLSFTRYEASNEQLVLRRGFFRTETDELLIYRIADIRLVRTLWQKIFGVGTVTLLSTDKTTPSLELKNIKQPEEVRRFLGKLIAEQREKHRVSSSEMVGGGMGHRFHDRDGDGHEDHSV